MRHDADVSAKSRLRMSDIQDSDGPFPQADVRFGIPTTFCDRGSALWAILRR